MVHLAIVIVKEIKGILPGLGRKVVSDQPINIPGSIQPQRAKPERKVVSIQIPEKDSLIFVFCDQSL